MKKKSSIISFTIIGVLIILGFVLMFCPIRSKDANVKDYRSFAGTIKKSLDVKGGYYAVYEAKENPELDIAAELLNIRSDISDILTDYGYTESEVVVEGTNRLRVYIPNFDDDTNVLSILGRPAKIEYRLQDNPSEIIVSPDQIKYAGVSAQGSSFALKLTLTKSGAKRLTEVTSAHLNENMEVMWTEGGNSQSLYTPQITQADTSGVLYIGFRTRESALGYATQINMGLLKLELSQIGSTQEVQAPLGKNALLLIMVSVLIGLILIMAFMCYAYRLYGVAGSLSLLLYIILTVFMFGALPWVQMSLSGMAGALLALCLTISGNIMIFERIKEEYRNGKSILNASHHGLRKSISAIADMGIISVLASILLVAVGAGAVRSFGLTLLVGSVLGVLCSLVLTTWTTNAFININQANPDLYNLKRGEGFTQLDADQEADEGGDTQEVRVAQSIEEAPEGGQI